MSSGPCWVGLEGQNFAASILDTQDLSTIRGGSLLLRDLVGKAGRDLTALFPGRVTLATQGGSFGIWRVDAPAPEVQAALRGLRSRLAAGDGQHLGFGVVAVADDGTGYARQRKRLRAALQRARLAETRLPYPALDDLATGDVAGVCPVDFVRPIATGTGRRIAPDKTRHTSRSVCDRRQFGIDSKQTLLRDETRGAALSQQAKTAMERPGRPFAMQIGSISERKADRARLKTNLQDKICVIALDGNGFGKVQDLALALSDRIETQQAFDRTLARMRRDLITQVFNRVIAEGCEGPPVEEEAETRRQLKDPLGPAGPVIRFELLLWGGDEIMFIVPGRVGWRILEQIGETIAGTEGGPEGLRFDAASLGLEPGTTLKRDKVTFSVGAVFCHHDAPIARVKALADELCGHIKRLKKAGSEGRDGKEDTLFMVEVLESFDHVGMDLGAHLRKRTPKSPGTPPADASHAVFSDATQAAIRVLDLAEVKALRCAAEALASGTGGALSRGRLRQTAFALHRGAVPGAEFAGKAWVDYVAGSAALLRGEARMQAEDVFKACGPAPEGTMALGRARLFTLMEEYWDYLTPEKDEESVS